MKIYFSFLFFLLLITSPVSAQETPLKTELEKAWNAVAVALKSKNYETFLAAIDTSRAGAEKVSKEDFPHYAEIVGRIIQINGLNKPNLTFVALRKNKSWAGYYSYSIDQESPNGSKMNLDMALFHQVNGVWKLSPPNYGASFSKQTTEEGNRKEAIKLMEMDSRFKLPDLP